MKKLVAFGLLLSPLAAFAQQTTNFFQLVGVFQNVIATLTPFIIGLAVLVIIWGLFNYIAGAGDEEKRGEAKQYIIWGIIGLFVMTAIWGLVGVVSKTFNLGTFAIPTPQIVPCPGGQTFQVATDPTTGATTGHCVTK